MLAKWGKSIGVNLPVRDSINLEAVEEVEIIDKEDSIIINKFES